MTCSTNSASSYGIHYDILQRLLPTVHIYQYQGRQKFLDTYDQECHRLRSNRDASEFVIFTDVDAVVFLGTFYYSSDSSTKHCVSEYDCAARILVVKMTLPEHGQLHGGFQQEFLDSIQPRSLRRSLQSFDEVDLHGQGRTKRPNMGWGPIERPCYAGQRWPSLVVEVTVSESLQKLQSDMSYWLTGTYGQVNVAIGISIARTRSQTIRVGKWVRGDTGVPRCDQELIIEKKSRKDPSPIVKDGPLIIEFEQLFLRPPGPQEGNVVVDEESLGPMAANAWKSISCEPGRT